MNETHRILSSMKKEGSAVTFTYTFSIRQLLFKFTYILRWSREAVDAAGRNLSYHTHVTRAPIYSAFSVRLMYISSPFLLQTDVKSV